MHAAQQQENCVLLAVCARAYKLTRIFLNIALSFGGNGSLEGISVISLLSSAVIHTIYFTVLQLIFSLKFRFFRLKTSPIFFFHATGEKKSRTNEEQRGWTQERDVYIYVIGGYFFFVVGTHAELSKE